MERNKTYSRLFILSVICLIFLSSCLTEEIPLNTESGDFKNQNKILWDLPSEIIIKQGETLNVISAKIYIYVDRVTEYSEINKSVRMLVTLPDGFVQKVELNTNRIPNQYYLDEDKLKWLRLKDIKLIGGEYTVSLSYGKELTR